MWLWEWMLVCLSVSALQLTGGLSGCTPPSLQDSWDWLQHQCRISGDTTSPVLDQLISSFQITIWFLSSNLLLQIRPSSTSTLHQIVSSPPAVLITRALWFNLCYICVTNFAPLQVLQDCHATLGSVSQLSILRHVHSPSFLTFLHPLLTKLLPVPCVAYMLTSALLDFYSA